MQLLPRDSGGARAGKVPRGDMADVISAAVRRIGAERSVGLLGGGADPYPWTGAKSPDFLEILRTLSEGGHWARGPYRPVRAPAIPPIQNLMQPPFFPLARRRSGDGYPMPRYF